MNELIAQPCALLQQVTACHTEGKQEYPDTTIAVEIDNALYFLHGDAEKVAGVLQMKTEFHHGMTMLVLDKARFVEQLVTALYENKELMLIIKQGSHE